MIATTLANVLAGPTTAEPAIVIEATGVVITYRGLADQVERLAEELRAAGYRSGDAICIVLPDGAEFLALILALARAGLIAVPLNPAFKAAELRSAFAEIKPRALVAAPGNSVVAEGADGLAAPILTATVDPDGVVGLAGPPPGRAIEPETPNAEEVALILLTSGTEGLPKLVPLTHANVVSSAQHIAAHYALTPADRTLAVMPFFHGHGLIGAALATFVSGGAVIVSPHFSASRFWGSFRRHRATWYTAVPTIHEILLQRADSDDAPHRGPRFIRSCSAPLAPAVLAALECRFGAPVIEAYGLTEASHQVASNPLPPGLRQPGTVGFGIGTDIAIIDSENHHLPAHNTGEVVIRGPNVMHGYRDSPSSAAFVDGWFRTGDAGFLGDDGFLTLVGRIKELINRGGEKISPAEIDNVLLAHPAVAEAAAFGVPDAKYGERVEAAVVLKGKANPESLRAYCREHLADFKVPTEIRIVSGLPKNGLGKVERHALAALSH